MTDTPLELGPPTVVVDDIHVHYKALSTGKSLDPRMMIKLRRDKEITRDVHAVKGVSFVAHRGESIGVIGSNGSGKSTLLRAVAGLLRPSSGAVYTESTPSLLGVDAALLPTLSGAKNVMIGGLALGYSPAEVQERFDSIVEFAEIGRFIDLPMATYSSGMKARLRFAISASKAHSILILDEALAVGDKRFRTKSEKRAVEIREEAGTVFLVSHSMAAVRRTCTRAIWLDAGKVVMDGHPDEVCSAYENSAG